MLGAELRHSCLIPIYYYENPGNDYDLSENLTPEQKIAAIVKRVSEHPDPAEFLHQRSAPAHELHHFRAFFASNVGYGLVCIALDRLSTFHQCLLMRLKARGTPTDDEERAWKMTDLKELLL